MVGCRLFLVLSVCLGCVRFGSLSSGFPPLVSPLCLLVQSVLCWSLPTTYLVVSATVRLSYQQGRPTKLSPGFFPGLAVYAVLYSSRTHQLYPQQKTPHQLSQNDLVFCQFFVLDRIMQVARQRVELFWTRCTGNDAAGFVTLSWWRACFETSCPAPAKHNYFDPIHDCCHHHLMQKLAFLGNIQSCRECKLKLLAYPCPVWHSYRSYE